MNDNLARSVGINTGPDTHLDHLGVLCSILNIPLIVTENSTFDSAKKFYPDLNVQQLDPLDLSLDFLASNFDVLFGCGKFWAIELLPMIKLLHNKKMRLVFCPHGNSDKGHSIDPNSNISQDIALVYGDHMIDLLKKTGAFHKINSHVVTGNYRYPYYLKHKAFYDDLIKSQILPTLDPLKKTILYAPTWHTEETPTSFFQVCEELINQLSTSFNLIIKLHPFLEEHHPAHTYYLLSKYEDVSGVVFINSFPPIYPLLSACDIYLGDYSSIGYDFLAFDRPMFFFNLAQSDLKGAPGRFLHRCGQEIGPAQIPYLKEFIDQNSELNQREYSKVRQEIYTYAFGSARVPSEIQKNLSKIIL